MEAFHTGNGLGKLTGALQAGFINRPHEATAIAYGLALGEHVLLEGPPGTAKSLMAQYAFGLIDGGRVFSLAMSKTTPEEAVFGGYDMTRLREEGLLWHRTASSALEAEFIFFDELFDANDHLLRSLLTLFNERRFIKGSQQVETPLLSCISTSNYKRETEITEAILDRILFKVRVLPLEEREDRLELLHRARDWGPDYRPEEPAMSLEDLHNLKRAIREVRWSSAMVELYDELVHQFATESKAYVSDRRRLKGMHTVAARAHANGRTEVLADDMSATRYALFVSNDEKGENIWREVYQGIVGARYLESQARQHIEEAKARVVSICKDAESARRDRDADGLERLRQRLSEQWSLLANLDCPTPPTRSVRDQLVVTITQIDHTIREYVADARREQGGDRAGAPRES